MAQSQARKTLPFGHRRFARGAILCALLFLSGCGDSEPPQHSAWGGRQGATTVVTESVAEQSLIETIQAVGTARALHSVVLFPEAAGIVRAVHFAADQRVSEGEILLQLDSRDELLAVQLAEVQLADAERLARRYEMVNREDANLPQSQIDAAIAAADTARITLDQARVNLDRRAIKAPFDGVVGITEIDAGDRIDTGTEVTTLDDRSQLLVNFAVPEVYVGKIQPGTAVDVRLWDGAERPFQGEVIAVDSRIDPTSRAFIARASIDNSTDRYRPGMAFEISVRAERGVFLAVPDVAVQWGADGAYIWVEEDGKAARREVRLVKRLAGEILIESDVLPGSRVVTEGVQAVRAGSSLRDLNPTRDTTRAASAPGEVHPNPPHANNG